jgi:hypothetical protein
VQQRITHGGCVCVCACECVCVCVGVGWRSCIRPGCCGSYACNQSCWSPQTDIVTWAQQPMSAHMIVHTLFARSVYICGCSAIQVKAVHNGFTLCHGSAFCWKPERAHLCVAKVDCQLVHQCQCCSSCAVRTARHAATFLYDSGTNAAR